MGHIVADQVLAEYIKGCFENHFVEIVVPAHQCRGVVVPVCGYSIRAWSCIHKITSLADSPKHLAKEADRQVPSLLVPCEPPPPPSPESSSNGVDAVFEGPVAQPKCGRPCRPSKIRRSPASFAWVPPVRVCSSGFATLLPSSRQSLWRLNCCHRHGSWIVCTSQDHGTSPSASHAAQSSCLS